MKKLALTLSLVFCLYAPAKAGNVETPPAPCNPSDQQCQQSAPPSALGTLLAWLGITD